MKQSRKLTKRPDKRYYYDLFRKVRLFRVDLEQRGWMNLWHQHFDWEGFGDLSWVHRRRHISALLQALARARIELKNQSMAHQVFATVHVPGSANNALYVHTENPHAAFPCKLSGRALAFLPATLAGRVDLRLYEVLSSHSQGEISYVIQPRA